MDYCHPCRRHLNGALACAGCGTPADALAPCAVGGPTGLDAGSGSETVEVSGGAGHRRRPRGSAAGRSRGRRRNGHRRRGRALLLSVVGVVLALGALSLAELAMEPEGGSGAADYVSEAEGARSTPPVLRSPESEPPAPVEAPTVVPVTEARPSAAKAPARTTAPAPPPPSSAPAEKAAPPAPTSGPPEPAATGTPDGPTGSGEPSEEPTAPGPSADPEPTPSPSPTCTWWIFCF
ncbi:hypothetical protein AB0M42_14055 [Streptomyces sp. NPDC051784]|uniref:SCO2400 family protein n=1 Tax=Streptomyces sp. NPDC051784 TaxID=3155805 RepID=UPI003433829F